MPPGGPLGRFGKCGGGPPVSCVSHVRVARVRIYMCEKRPIPGGKPKGGGLKWLCAWFWGSIGFASAWPSAAYEFVMESMTDWAFS